MCLNIFCTPITFSYSYLCVCTHLVMSGALLLFGLQPTWLLCQWDFPGKNTEVGCHFLLQGNLPDPGIEPVSPVSPSLAGGFFTTEPPGKSILILDIPYKSKVIFYFFKFFFFYLNFIFLLYNTVLVLPYIDMNPPQVLKKQSLFLLFAENLATLLQVTITNFEQIFVLKYHFQTLECDKHYSEIGVDLLLIRRKFSSVRFIFIQPHPSHKHSSVLYHEMSSQN